MKKKWLIVDIFSSIAGLVDIKQEVISPDEKSALQLEPPSLDSSIESSANDRFVLITFIECAACNMIDS